MYGYARHEVVDTTILTDNTVASTGVYVLGANRIAFEVATFTGTSGDNVSLSTQMCDTLTGTYRDLYGITANSAGSGVVLWQTNQSTGNLIAVCDNAIGAKYIKPKLSLTATTTVTVRVHIMK